MTNIEFSILILTVLSSISWAGFDAARKKLASSFSTASLAFWIIGAQLPFYFVWIFFVEDVSLSSAYIPIAIQCAICNLVANIGFLWSMKVAPMNLSIPLLSLTPAFTAIISYIALSETLSKQEITGIFVIILGSIVLQSGSLVSFLKNRHSKIARLEVLGLLSMLIVAFTWSLTSVLDKKSMEIVHPAIHAFIQCLGITIAVFFYMKREGGKSFKLNYKPARSWVFWAGIATAVFALSTQLIVIQEVYVGVFEAIKRSIGIISSLILGRILFREQVTLVSVISCMIITAGIWILLSN